MKPSKLLSTAALMGAAATAACGLSSTSDLEAQRQADTAAPVATLSGPMVGGVLQSAATVWLRASTARSVVVQYRKATDTAWTALTAQAPSSASDYTLRFALSGLSSNTAYQYQVLLDGVAGPTYTFSTTIADSNNKTPVSFSVLSDFKPAQAPTLASATNASAGFNPNFVLFMGDLDHSGPAMDSNGNILPPDQALTAMRTMRLRLRTPSTFAGGSNFGTDFTSAFTQRAVQVPLYNVWDDHDYCYNNADSTCPDRAQALQVFGEYFVVGRDTNQAAPQGAWQRLRYGQHLEVFVLDARSGRQADVINQDESMLGADQLAWLTNALNASQAEWKLVISPVPFNNTTKSWDSWAAGSQSGESLSFQSERSTLETLFLQKNVIILSGDIHSGGAINDGRSGTVKEISVPHANMGDFVDTYLRNGSPSPDSPHWDIGRDTPGAADFGWPLAGMPNGVSDPGFVYVTVTPRANANGQYNQSSLLITVRDQNGALKTTPYNHTPLSLCLNGPCTGAQP